MDNSNVVRFPSVGRPPAAQSPEGLQLGLFNWRDTGSGRISFFDIQELTEKTLLEVVARNSVRSLFDLRAKPIFEKPRFNHKAVVSYLYRHDVRYCEYVMLTDFRADAKSRNAFTPEMTKALQEVLSRGLIMCIYDAAAKDRGLVHKVREAVRTMPRFEVELPSRALAGSVS
jgi:hypothetical protein